MSNPLSGEAEASAETGRPSREEVIAYMRENVVDSRTASDVIGLSGTTAMHYYVRPGKDGGPGILAPLMKLNGGHLFYLPEVEELRKRLIRDGHAKNRLPR